MSVVVDGTNGLVFNDASTQTTAASGFGFKNRIINGSFNVWQRGTSFPQTGLSFGGIYLADRFYIESTNSTAASTWSQAQDAPAGFTYSLKQTVTATQASPAATGHYYGLCQQIEGFNFADFAYGTQQAAPAVLSFWVKSSVTGTFAASFVLTGGTPGEKTYPFTYTISTPNTWVQVIINIPGNTAYAPTSVTNGAAARIEFYTLLSAGYAAGTAGTWNTNASANQYASTQGVNLFATSGATWQIAGIQLEKGPTATPFDYRPYGAELALCQRYYFKTGGSSSAMLAIGQCFSSTGALIGVTTPQIMRATPSLTYANLALWSAGTNGLPITGLAVGGFSGNVVRLDAVVSSGLVAGNATFLNAGVSSGTLELNAEL